MLIDEIFEELQEDIGAKPVDARQIAKALLVTARQQVPDNRYPVEMAKQMANVLNDRIKRFIEEYDKESTWQQ